MARLGVVTVTQDLADQCQNEITIRDLSSTDVQAELTAMPAASALELLADHGRELLRRRAELPDTERAGSGPVCAAGDRMSPLARLTTS